MGKLFVFSDIHGCFDKFNTLMDKVSISFKEDTVVFLGDYIDRGPNSFEVVEFLIGLKRQHKNLIFLKGNHEDMFLKYLSGTDRLVFLANGGQQTLESYMNRNIRTNDGLVPSDHFDFLESLILYHETEDFIFVHAGLKDNVPLKEQDPEDLLWIRRSFIESEHDFGKLVIFGHTPLPEALILPNKIGIDTGAVYGKKLTCVELTEMEFFEV